MNFPSFPESRGDKEQKPCRVVAARKCRRKRTAGARPSLRTVATASWQGPDRMRVGNAASEARPTGDATEGTQRGPSRESAAHRRNESSGISTVLVCGDGPDPPTGRPYMSDVLRSYGHAS
jgi:hypothetical protein